MGMHLKPHRIAFKECLVHIQIQITLLNVQALMVKSTKKVLMKIRSLWELL